MNRNKFHFVAAAAISLILFCGVLIMIRLGSVASAQEGAVIEQSAVVGVTSTLLGYQGRLTDPSSGEAVADGSYTMVLRLYTSPSGGTPLWTEAKDVPVQDGLFSTVLGDTTPLIQDIFDGRELWLGIKVGADEEAAPRQQILPVAYALGLVPGTAVEAKSSKAALSVSNAGSGPALQAGGPVVIDGSLEVKGALSGNHAGDPSAHHKRYTDAEAVSAALKNPEIVTQYEFEDHIYGGMHSGRAIASGVINGDGTVAAATGNVTSKWNSTWQCYEITIAGHHYDWQSYVTVVTPVAGGVANAWSSSGKLRVGIYDSDGKVIKLPFQFVIFQP